MYQLYKDQYTTQGKKAMQDTLGQASALNSGYGSSYAQSAAQQTYQNYLQDLNNMIPTLRNQAYNEYMQEGQDLLNKYNVSSDAYNREYGQYRDSVADWQADRSFNYGMYSDERNFDYNKFNADRNYWNQEYWNERNSAQSNQQAAVENNWNDAYSKQDTYSKTNYWENSNTNYWSNTASAADSWSQGFSQTAQGNSGAAAKASADFSKIVAGLQNTNRNNLTSYEIGDDTRSFLSDYGLGADSVFANMSGTEANRVLTEMAQQANTASSLNEYLQLLDDMQQRFNLSDAEIQAIMKKSNR